MKQIYVHGLGQKADSWKKVTEGAAALGNVLCPDLSELVKRQEVTYQNIYAAFSDVCNATKDDISLCGLSLGGILALNYVIDRPEKVKKLILIAAQYKMPKKLLKVQNSLFWFMPKSMFYQMGFEKVDFLKLCSTMMELDFSDSICKVSCPTLVICGEKDRANKAASIKLANMLKTAEFRVLKGVGHEVNIEAPERLSKMIRSFLDSGYAQ